MKVNEPATTVGSPGELLSRRCVGLLKNALRPDVWPNSDLKLVCLDKILRTVESPQPNIANICMALELLGFLLQFLVGHTHCSVISIHLTALILKLQYF